MKKPYVIKKNGKFVRDFTEGKSLTASFDKAEKYTSKRAAIVAAQVRKALNGDERAATFIRDLTGQMPIIEQNITARVENPYEGLTTEQLIALAEKDE